MLLSHLTFEPAFLPPGGFKCHRRQVHWGECQTHPRDVQLCSRPSTVRHLHGRDWCHWWGISMAFTRLEIMYCILMYSQCWPQAGGKKPKFNSGFGSGYTPFSTKCITAELHHSLQMHYTELRWRDMLQLLHPCFLTHQMQNTDQVRTPVLDHLQSLSNFSDLLD